MKKNLNILFLLCALMGAFLHMNAQEKKVRRLYTLEECIPGGRDFYETYPAYLSQMQWLGNQYVYAEGATLMGGSMGNAVKETPVMSAVDINAFLPTEHKLPRTDYFPGLDMVDAVSGTALITLQKATCLVNLTERKTLAVFPHIANVAASEWNANRTMRALVINHNICLQAANQTEKELTTVTKDGNEALVYGESVHQREFGIEGGLFWSPDGKKLAFYRMDQSMVAPYPIVNVRLRKAAPEPVRYPMAGMPSHHVTVGIYDVASGRTVYLKTGEPKEKFLTNLSWSPDGKTLYIAEINRAQTDSELKAYDVTTGECSQTLFAEHNDKYIEPQHGMTFVPGKPDQFIWQSRRDGWSHLYLYRTNGKLIRQITRGDWEVMDLLGFDASAKKVFFTSTAASPLERRLYAVDLTGKNFRDLTPEKGVHRPQLSPDRKFFIDQLQSPTVPRRYDLRSTDGKQNLTLFTAPNPDEEYDMPTIETGTLTANDGKTPLHYMMVKPLDMEPGKKYPVIVYVYGGPHAQMLTNGWHSGASGWDIYQAQHGYVIFTLDNRGSANRGAAFEQVIHRHVGEVEMQDQMTGVEFLKSLPFVDADRIGVHGWSYGGFMTTNLMLTHPDVFKVGVAGGPVIDWSLYEIMYGERYMDTPQENPEGYKNSNLLLRAGNLKGRLLQIHGDIDPVVVWQHSLLFQQACVHQNTYPDYFIYPGHEHNVMGHDRVHLHEKINRYFRDYL